MNAFEVLPQKPLVNQVGPAKIDMALRGLTRKTNYPSSNICQDIDQKWKV